MIIASFEKSAFGRGGISLIYESLSHFGINLVLQENNKAEISKDTKLVIGFGHPSCLPPQGDWKRGMVYASPMLQSELSDELPIITFYTELMRRGHLDYLFFTDSELAGAFQFFNQFPDRVFWLPACDFRTFSISEERSHVLVPGLFRANKNNINQLIALHVNRNKDNFIIDDVLLTGSDKEALSNFYHNISGHSFKWVPYFDDRDKLNQIVSKSKFIMQVSLSESFCYSVYEACMSKVPSITSFNLDWYRGELINKYCLIENVDSVPRMAYQINKLYNLDTETYKALCEEVYSVGVKTMDNHIYETTKLFNYLKSVL